MYRVCFIVNVHLTRINVLLLKSFFKKNDTIAASGVNTMLVGCMEPISIPAQPTQHPCTCMYMFKKPWLRITLMQQKGLAKHLITIIVDFSLFLHSLASQPALALYYSWPWVGQKCHNMESSMSSYCTIYGLVCVLVYSHREPKLMLFLSHMTSS